MWIKKPEFIFIIFAFIFGLLFMFLTPYNKVPDEISHLRRACEVADGIFYSKTPVQSVKCDKYLEKEIAVERDGKVYPTSGYPPLLYAFPALGLNVGKLLGGSVMFYLARIFNLFAWIAMIALAIRITPVFKYLFLFAALLPMSLFEGMSVSADSFNNAFAFLFFAFVFKLIYDKQELNKKDYILLSIMTILSAFTKGSVYQVFLFFFLPLKKHRYTFAILSICAAFLLSYLWASTNTPFINTDGANPEYHKYLLLHNPLDFVQKYIKTLVLMFTYYIKGCIGILGWLNLRLNPIAYILTSVIFMFSFLFIPEKKITNLQRVTAFCVFLIFTTIFHIIEYIVWTPPEIAKITGVQGRYFISMLPLIFMIFAQPKAYFSEKVRKYFKITLIVFVGMLLFYTCLRLMKDYQPSLYYFYMFKHI